ncbi:MAG: ASCH domain-containing protein [Oscillospiraceae bacterium]
MTAQELWGAYLLEHPCSQNEHYEAWCYGSDTPDLLAELTVSGTKTATASAYPFYEYENCRLPKVGEHNIILDTSGSAVCITQTTRVTVVPFLEVSAEQAYKEGEGDRSLQYWRTVHAKFFAEELTEIGVEFSEDMLVVCEEFRVVFRSMRIRTPY